MISMRPAGEQHLCICQQHWQVRDMHTLVLNQPSGHYPSQTLYPSSALKHLLAPAMKRCNQELQTAESWGIRQADIMIRLHQQGCPLGECPTREAALISSFHATSFKKQNELRQKPADSQRQHLERVDPLTPSKPFFRVLYC